MHLASGDMEYLDWETSPPWLKPATRYRWLRRLGRLDIREIIQADDGGVLGIVQKRIFRITQTSRAFQTVFEVPDGGRPKGFVLTPSGHLFVGEYWGNPRRQSLRLWGSIDNGQTWELAHVLPKGHAKHIHNLIWDDYRQGIWILTGDLEGECSLLFTPDEFKTVSEVVRGGQLFRACHLFCLPEGIYYGTDTERAENWFVLLSPDSGKVEKLRPLPGSCIYASKMAGQYLLATSVEPSKVNQHNFAGLWWSSDLQHWENVAEFEKDRLHGEYFGFGSVMLPRIQGNFPLIAFSPVAVKDHDLTTFIIMSRLGDQHA